MTQVAFNQFGYEETFFSEDYEVYRLRSKSVSEQAIT